MIFTDAEGMNAINGWQMEAIAYRWKALSRARWTTVRTASVRAHFIRFSQTNAPHGNQHRCKENQTGTSLLYLKQWILYVHFQPILCSWDSQANAIQLVWQHPDYLQWAYRWIYYLYDVHQREREREIIMLYSYISCSPCGRWWRNQYKIIQSHTSSMLTYIVY